MISISAFKTRVLAIFTGLAAALSAASAAEIVGIRFGETSTTETRVVLDADSDIAVQGAPAQSAQGLKVAFAPGTRFAAPARAARASGLVETYALTAAGAEASLELTFKTPSKIKSLFVIPPSVSNTKYRLVIDLEKGAVAAISVAAAPKFDTLTEVIAASIAPPAPQPAPPPAPETAAPTLKPLTGDAPMAASPGKLTPFKPVIVIDPGHGGTDPGAVGPSGSKEAVATLAAAVALSEALEKSGRYTVVLTRTKDERLAHEERSHSARAAKADLFISLHADAHSDQKVRGASVYTLSQEGSERSAREALAKGNYHVFDLDIGQADPEVGGILYNLAQRKTENESDRFAEALIGGLRGATPLLNNSHRRGNFKVLLAPDVPAVLLELAFISNKKDEANLGSPAWRTRTASAVAGAIDAYFEARSQALHASNISASSTR